VLTYLVPSQIVLKVLVPHFQVHSRGARRLLALFTVLERGFVSSCPESKRAWKLVETSNGAYGLMRSRALNRQFMRRNESVHGIWRTCAWCVLRLRTVGRCPAPVAPSLPRADKFGGAGQGSWDVADWSRGMLLAQPFVQATFSEQNKMDVNNLAMVFGTCHRLVPLELHSCCVPLRLIQNCGCARAPNVTLVLPITNLIHLNVICL
jgi:hypothetical protein